MTLVALGQIHPWPLPFAPAEIAAGVGVIAVAYADPKELFTRAVVLPGRVKYAVF
jgi:hypothetical protein